MRFLGFQLSKIAIFKRSLFTMEKLVASLFLSAQLTPHQQYLKNTIQKTLFKRHYLKEKTVRIVPVIIVSLEL